MAKVLGLGGIFFKCKDPDKLAAWYKDWLEFPLDSSFSASFPLKKIPQNAYNVWGAFKSDTTYFEPSHQSFMINLIVDDLTSALDQVKKGGAQIIGKPESNEYGQFGWFIDPEGNKVELWVPNKDS